MRGAGVTGGGGCGLTMLIGGVGSAIRVKEGGRASNAGRARGAPLRDWALTAPALKSVIASMRTTLRTMASSGRSQARMTRTSLAHSVSRARMEAASPIAALRRASIARAALQSGAIGSGIVIECMGAFYARRGGVGL